MFHSIEKNISGRVSEYVRDKYGVEGAGALEQPKQPSFGELAIPDFFSNFWICCPMWLFL